MAGAMTRRREGMLMNAKGRGNAMLVPTIVMGALALALLLLAYFRGQGEHVAGARTGLELTAQVLPLLLFAFLAAGLVQVLLPKEMISTWIGPGSGLRGILLGTAAGIVTPGGPFVSMPVAAGLLKTGAGVGTIVAFMTAWSLWAVARLPMELGILGWKFAAIRLACTLFFPPIAGLLATTFFGRVNLT
jgi:uncharacterized membrane protein YraQ (UPF0718 family)